MRRLFLPFITGLFIALTPRLSMAQTTILDTLTGSTLVQQENVAVGMAGGPGQPAYAVPGVVVTPAQDFRITSLTTVVMINSARTPQDVGFGLYRGELSNWQAIPNPTGLQAWGGTIQSASLLGTAGISRFWQVNLAFTDPTFTVAGGVNSFLGITGIITAGDVGLGLIQELSLAQAPSIHWRARKFTATPNDFAFYGQGSAAAIPYRYHPVIVQGVAVTSSAPEPGAGLLVLLGFGVTVGFGVVAARRRK
jgi:hypothetical protein